MEKLTYGGILADFNKIHYFSQTEFENIKDTLVINSEKYQIRVFNYSCEYSDLELSKWLYNLVINKNPAPSGMEINKLKYSAFYSSCCSGNLETAKWLYELKIDINYKYSEEVLELFTTIASCKNRNINGSCIDEKNISEEDENKFLETLKWFYELYSTDIDINPAFRISCSNGTIKIAKWLYSLGKINIHMLQDKVFSNACINGKLEMAKWLHEIDKAGKSNVEDIFIKTCENGQLELAQWLYSEYFIDIHAHKESAFISSCHGGYLDIAKWLYSLCENSARKIDFYEDDCILFKKYHNSNEEIIDWLNTIDKVQDMHGSGQIPDVLGDIECIVCNKAEYDIILGCGHILCKNCFKNLYIKYKIERRCLVCKKIVLFKECFSEAAISTESICFSEAAISTESICFGEAAISTEISTLKEESVDMLPQILMCTKVVFPNESITLFSNKYHFFGMGKTDDEAETQLKFCIECQLVFVGSKLSEFKREIPIDRMNEFPPGSTIIPYTVNF